MKVRQEDILNETYITIIEDKLKIKKDKEMLKELEILKQQGIGYIKDYEFEIPRLVQIPKDNGKLRDIFIYPTKSNLIIKLLTESLNEKFTNEVSEDVYSYRKGFRIYHAVQAVQRDMKEGVRFIKLDISNYFMEIGIDKVLPLLEHCFNMDYLGKEVIKMFTRNKYYFKDSLRDGYLGLMPGSPLSCTLSNLILRELDDVMAETTQSYTRYSDDIIIGCKTEKELENAIERITDLLEEYSLEVNPSKVEYFGDNRVEFLGLVVTPNYIDINTKKLKAIKSYIKRDSKRLRKSVELGKYSSKVALDIMIKKYNRKMYKTILKNDKHVGTGGFILSNISTMDSIRGIDFYFINQCRYIITGKYNKANVNKLSIEELEDMGYRSMCELYKLSCMDKHIYMNEVHNLR